MERRFRGESDHKVDSKGRVSIPAPFRRVLEEGDPNWTDGLNPELVIVYGGAQQNHLACYTMLAINDVGKKIDRLPRGSRARKALQRRFDGQSYQTSVDETGRLVLPARLRHKIGLKQEAFFIGAGDTFEIWEPQTYQEEEAEKDEEWREEIGDDEDLLMYLDQQDLPAE